MKIAFLASEFPHPSIGIWGGIGTSIFNLSKGLLQMGHKVIVVVYGQDKDECFEENGIAFYKIKNVRVPGFSMFLTQKKIQKKLNALIAENKIDIVEAPDWTGITSFIKLKCPLIIKLHGSDTYFCHLDNRPVKCRNRFYEGLALKNADALLSVSQYTADVTKQLFGLKRDFTVIPNAVDLAQFTIDSKKNAAAKANTILYFGTLIRKKGLLELPFIFNELLKLNTDAKLILIGRDSADIISGNSSTWEMMKKLFNEKAIPNVSYLGSVPYNEIKKHINEASVCVFPTFAEALPVSWIEAMAVEKPIVASNIGWASEIITDTKDGFLVHPKNHEKYAKKINELLKDPDLMEQFGKNARKKAEEKFSLEVVARQSLDFYQEVKDKYKC